MDVVAMGSLTHLLLVNVSGTVGISRAQQSVDLLAIQAKLQ